MEIIYFLYFVTDTHEVLADQKRATKVFFNQTIVLANDNCSDDQKLPRFNGERIE